eukprot:CAMPEP_0170591918 /NCGR_PEP_ID=MMETSP0224-20130122/12659_1 /TAXON_ID=285029 /ORGANISM="Togula jolla, Strain CCCM 725" /LENGTH=250 /DNA_ID=CAMNT_0010915813 /DNA_START=86 /DNA_END=838 /DNA_ORIENTATION=+
MADKLEERKERHSGDPKTSVKQHSKKEGGGGKYSVGKPEDQDGPSVLDKGDPNYDSEEEEKPKAPTGPPVWEGAAAGKYQWDDSRTGGDADKDIGGEAITKYSWADGKKLVSIYIELEGLDEVADDALTTESGEKEVSLTIASIKGQKKRFAVTGLFSEIDGVKLQRKMGKNTVVLKLQKKEEKSWYKLLESSGKGGGDDEDGGMGGMGGMPGMGGMGGMPGMGGMGGMDMASMMAGMGGGMGGMPGMEM